MNSSAAYTLITGGSEGIGFELARQFVEHGHNVILVAREQIALTEAKNSLAKPGIDIITIISDLFNPNAPFELLDTLGKRGVTVDILVNNAGQGEYGLFANTDIRRELEIIQLNIAAPTILTKLFLKGMLEKGYGRILNVASIAGKIPGPWQSVYHGTKAYMHSFSEALRSELENTGITVTSLLPGATDTKFFEKAGMEASKIVQEKDKLADPADVAKDGYAALMRGDDKVISGFKNQLSVAISNLMPEATATNNMKQKLEPAK